MWSSPTVDHRSTIKRNGVLTHVTESTNLESFTLNDRNQAQNHILNNSVHVEQPERAQKQEADCAGGGGEPRPAGTGSALGGEEKVSELDSGVDAPHCESFTLEMVTLTLCKFQLKVRAYSLILHINESRNTMLEGHLGGSDLNV